LKIDSTVLSENELIDLHRRIVERLRFLLSGQAGSQCYPKIQIRRRDTWLGMK
jgi:hypothetical protein